jgi:hypothetical protein
MRHRRIARAAATGLIAVTVTIGLFPLPAAASEVDVTYTGGTLEIYSSTDTLLLSVDLAAAPDCETPRTTFDFDYPDPGKYQETVSTTKRHGTQIITTGKYRNGTYTGTGNTKTLTPTTGWYDFTLIRTANPTSPCVPSTTSGTCTITSVGIMGTGELTATDPANLTTGDAFLWNGDNGPAGDLGFETSVSGTATACGSLISADDGYVAIVDETYEVD